MKPTITNTRLVCILGLLGLILTSCGPSHLFTEDSRNILVTQGIEIENIQFYCDKDIIMRRKSDKTQTEITNGEIKQIDGKLTEEVRIPRGTPGIIDSIAELKLYISFEDCRDCILLFSKNSFDAYQVDAESWIEVSGKVMYGGKVFYLTPPNHDAMLLVKKSEIYKPEKRGRTAKGLRVEEQKKPKKKKKKIRRRDIKRVDPNTPEENEEDLWDEGDDDGAFEE